MKGFNFTKYVEQLSTAQAVLKLLGALAVLSFVARFWQHVRWDPPFRAFFWNATFMETPASWLGFTWQEYATSPSVDGFINGLGVAVGILYLACAISVVAIRQFPKTAELIIKLGVGAIVIWGFLKVLSGLRYLQFFEYAAQLSLPLFFLYFYKTRQWSPRSITLMKVAIGLTFIGHGLFALGYYPVPGKFVDMTIRGFGFSEDGARMFLLCIGIMDIAMAAGLFLTRWPKVVIFFAGYGFVWGLMTAMARLYTNFLMVNTLGTLDRWLFEVFIRSAHFGLPLVLLLYLLSQQSQKNAAHSPRRKTAVSGPTNGQAKAAGAESEVVLG